MEHMKLKDFIIAAILSLLVIWSFQDSLKLVGLLEQINQLQSDTATMRQELQTIQDNYVSHDNIQPLMETLTEYRDRLEWVEDDQKFYKTIWREYFGMEVDGE
jgi:superfamily II RNA helicase